MGWVNSYNRITLHVPPCRRIIIPMEVIMQPRFHIKRLASINTVDLAILHHSHRCTAKIDRFGGLLRAALLDIFADDTFIVPGRYRAALGSGFLRESRTGVKQAVTNGLPLQRTRIKDVYPPLIRLI